MRRICPIFSDIIILAYMRGFLCIDFVLIKTHRGLKSMLQSI